MATPVERLGSLAVGRIELVTAQELRVSLYSETPQATALNTGMPTGFPRINAYIVIPNETGAVAAVVREIFITTKRVDRSEESSGELVDLPFPARVLIATPFGTLTRDDDTTGRPLYKLERGVPVLPSVGDGVLLPTPMQLRSIVEAEEGDRLVQVGTAPFAGNAKVWVHPDKLFGRHLAVLGNTGSGKSCSVAGIVRWSLEAAREAQPNKLPNARFIVLDPNGEYADAYRHGQLKARRYAVEGTDQARPLTVPGWLWNGQEWAAFTAAQGGVQRPLLLRALRLLRNAGEGVQTVRDQAVRRYRGYLRLVEQLYANLPQSVAGFPQNKNFAELLEGAIGLTTADESRLDAHAKRPRIYFQQYAPYALD
jgi:hypothetical protein